MSLWLYKGKILVNSDGTVVDDDECCCNKSSSAVKCWFKYASYLQAGCDDSGSWSCKWTAPTLQAQGCSATNPFGYAPGVWHFQCGGTSDASVRGTGYYVTSIVPEGNPTDCNGVTCTAPGFNGPIPEGDCPASGNPYFKLESYSGYVDAGFTPQRGEFDWQIMLHGSPVENTAMLDPHEEGYYYEYRMVKTLANQTDHDTALFSDCPRFKDLDPTANSKTKQTSYQVDGAHWCNRSFSWKLTWSDEDKVTFKSKSTPSDFWTFQDAELGDKGRAEHNVYSKTAGYYDADTSVKEGRYDVPEGTNYIKRNMCPTWSDDFRVWTDGAAKALADYWNNNYYTPFMEALSANGLQWCVYSDYVTDAVNAGDASETKYTGYVIDMEATVKLWYDLSANGSEKYCPELQKWIPVQIEGIGNSYNVTTDNPFFRPTLKGVNFSWTAGTCNMRGWAIRESHLERFSDQYQEGDCFNGHMFESYEDWNNNNYSPMLCQNTLVPTLYKTVSKFFAPSPTTNCTGQATSLAKISGLHEGQSECTINGTSGFRMSNLLYAADIMKCRGLDTYSLQLIYLSARNNFPFWYYNTDRTTQILPATMENPLQMYYAHNRNPEDTSCECRSEWKGSDVSTYDCSVDLESSISRLGCAVVFQVMYEWIPQGIYFNVTDRDSTGWDEKDCRGDLGLSQEGALTVVRLADLDIETTAGSYYSYVQEWNYKSAQLSGIGWHCDVQGHTSNTDPTLSNTDYGLDQVDLSSVKDALKGFRNIFSCGSSRQRFFGTEYIGTLIHRCYAVVIPVGCYDDGTSIGGVDLITSMPTVKTKPTYTISGTDLYHGTETTASGGATIGTIEKKWQEVASVLQARADDPVIMGGSGIIKFSYLTRGNGIRATDSGESTATGVSTTANCRTIIYEDITTSAGTIPLDSAEELDIIETAERTAISLFFSSTSMEDYYFKAGEAPDPDDLKEDHESAITALETILKSCKVEPEDATASEE